MVKLVTMMLSQVLTLNVSLYVPMAFTTVPLGKVKVLPSQNDVSFVIITLLQAAGTHVKLTELFAEQLLPFVTVTENNVVVLAERVLSVDDVAPFDQR
jgi:hypothetical protein